MELEDLLLREQSRLNTDLVINIVKAKPEVFEDLWKIVLLNTDPLSRRAAWAADYCAEINPDFIQDKIEELSARVTYFKSDGLKRHALRMLSRSPLPDENLGVLADACFNWLQSPSESVAVKMYSMVILHRISDNIPEIRRELYDIIEIQLEEATPGFRNIGLKIMKKLAGRR
ncbi:MAG: hypothetical protein IPH20_06635 [Bacteroidales bacterium]|jgi:hypothetical protein|nr:hypothetical protein [Bacteroidales bacterium]